jgi:hypothetical protein
MPFTQFTCTNACVQQHLHLIHICMQEVELFFFLCDQHEVYTVADIFIVLQVFFPRRACISLRRKVEVSLTLVSYKLSSCFIC